MPLWLSEEPHWRGEEWIALEMWLALRRVEICDGERGGTGVCWLRAAGGSKHGGKEEGPG